MADFGGITPHVRGLQKIISYEKPVLEKMFVYARQGCVEGVSYHIDIVILCRRSSITEWLELEEVG